MVLVRHIATPEKLALIGSTIFYGDAINVLRRLDSESVQAVVTSPPYWGVRDYGITGQIGLEPTVEQYINSLVSVFSEVKRILKKDGTLWLNIGDTYTSGNRRYRASDKKNPARGMDNGRPDTPVGLKRKDLIGLPWRVAFALQNDGWYLRSEVIWHKPNAMPESVKDRPTRCHESIFLLAKSEKYHYDYNAVTEPAKTTQTRGLRSVWSQNTVPFSGNHFATFPVELIEPCICASTRVDDYILDPFFGVGTVGLACQGLNRKFVGIELNSEYVKLAAQRLSLSQLDIYHVAC